MWTLLLTINIFLLSLKNSKSKEKIKFTLKEIGKTNCEPYHGVYHFYLNGDFDKEFNNKDKITIKLEYPHASAECLAYSKSNYPNDFLRCDLDICEFPLDENILFSPEEPISDTFSFPNWNSFMNKIPGISNKINSSDPYCYPNYEATFIPNDIESEGCKGNKNKFVVKGYWDNIEKVKFEKGSFNMHIQNQEDNIAQCNFDTLEQFYCLFEGNGTIQFDSFYFKVFLSPYKVSSLEKNINVGKCEGKSENDDSENENNFLNKNNIIILFFSFLLLLIL